MSNSTLNRKTGSQTQEKIQKFGRFLSGMVMPNIGAFIAWGLITALFIPDGWIPSEFFATLVGPMITYLLPLLIGYTGGKAVGGQRGAVLGAAATMGVIVGSEVPMFIGAMIMGPLGGYVIKKFDQAVEGKIPAGFEMLVNNFSIGIIGTILAMFARWGIGPVVSTLSDLLGNGVDAIVEAGLLPLTSIFIEPAKILFLNNAINHGVLGPIGIDQAKEVGKSVMFLLEANPGPGLGILLAYWVFAKGKIKQSAPGAIIIHFLGGIHEIYFPYVLMNPALVLAVIAGGASGILVFNIFGIGLRAAASPGSIFAVLAMTAKGDFIGVILGILVAAAVSFFVASIFVKKAADKMDDSDLEDAKVRVAEAKAASKGLVKREIKKVIFACDAGMGSSAMGATSLRSKFKSAGINVGVYNSAIEDIPEDADVVVTHEKLTDRAKAVKPDAYHISVKDFIDNNVFEILKAEIAPSELKSDNTDNVEENEILKKSNIKLGLKASSKDEAIRMAGELLVKGGYVDETYIDAMFEREKELTTYIGNGLAIPHGVGSARDTIKKSGIVVLQFPEGVKFGDETAYLVIGIAGVGNEHLSILGNIVTAVDVENKDVMEMLRTTKDVDAVYNLLTISEEE
ncbi:PTS mannitol transporter subunit IICBA [Clostridium thermarum]|uniref:PTS mannitol transporter subunit IICBA n=1 Tax=Clostridium thermarum TaxID=1716543 RepID=UPI00111EA6DB|nr:PTS mannitol transporter subunit IICBA [Clostridium thermarum]